MSVHIKYETPKEVAEDVYELVLSAGKDGVVKCGSNEVTKAAERGTAQMIVMAENVNPAELLAHIPLICKEKKIPFIYVEDQAYLAEAAGMSSGAKTAAIALMEVSKGAQEAFSGVKDQADALN